MILIICYLIAWVVILAALFCIDVVGYLPTWIGPYNLGYRCAIISGLGGVIYCLRGIYCNCSVMRRPWDNVWNVWYYLRPMVSLLIGLVAYIFLNAGGMILDFEKVPGSSPYGFLAIAFMAGLNVDGFLTRVEQVAQSAWSIKPSRASKQERKENETDHS